MRFRFCGDLDCPDWVLAEINTLSKMSSIKVEILCRIVAEFLTGGEFDEEKATKLVLNSKLDIEDMKACVAALAQIFTSSARYGVKENVLISELQQLGLPKENAVAVGMVYGKNLSLLTKDLATKSLRTTTLEEVNFGICDLRKQKIQLRIRLNDRIEESIANDAIWLTSEKLTLLLNDLKLARDEMLNFPVE